MNDKYIKKALNLILKFRDEKLDCDIKKLATFSFWGIRDNGKGIYDNGKNYADGDCTKLAYAIDYLLYHLTLENYSTKYYPNGNYNYHGDTICTFNTLFGSTNDIRQRVFKTLQLDSNEIEKIINENSDNFGKDFYHVYQRMGNFFLLPCKTIKIDNKYHSLNTYKGCFQNDYFDIFLAMLKDKLNNGIKTENNFEKLINENVYFFKGKKLDDFCKIFNLPNDFTLNGSGLHYAHWILSEKNKNDYRKFVFEYIEKATELIEKRSESILNSLLKKYPELKN
ncbi:MAG: hypothetical protein J6I53_01110 [Treponema sp.]|nr:hypothetical protein [Treponema sp.]